MGNRDWHPVGPELDGPTGESARVHRVRAEIAEASRMAADAADAYRAAGERAGRLHAAAECAHRDLLRSICDLSESEADSVEPAFTELEKQLMRLPGVHLLS